MAAPSFQDVYLAARAEALARRPSARIEPGTRYDMIMAGIAAAVDLLIGFDADRIKATYVDGAVGADLTILADDHFGITRFAAVKATGQVTFTRPSPTVSTYSIPAGSVVATERDAQGNEVRFVTTAPANWASLVGGTQTVAAEAEVAGVAGNVAANTITRVITFQSETITVNNALVFVGGSAQETDAALRERIRGFSQTIRRGTFAALEYGALQVAGVAKATAVEDSTGRATVYVTDEDGNSNPTMVAAVTTELLTWRACGALVAVIGGTLLPVDVNVTLTVRAGANVAQLLTSVQAAIETRMDQLEIGETVYRTAIVQAIRNVDVNIVEANVTMRTGVNPFASVDIAPSASQIPRAGSVSVS